MTDEKKITVIEMFPEKADFDELMDAFDTYQQEADGRGIKSVCEKNKEHISSLGVNVDFLPFYLMKKLIDRAMEQVDVKDEAVNEVEEMVKNFEKDEVNNIPPIINDAENKSEKEEVEGESASVAEAESDAEADNSC